MGKVAAAPLIDGEFVFSVSVRKKVQSSEFVVIL